MNLQQLEYFKIIAETKNFTTASDILSVTQPALSKAISKLEEELDVKLFQREGRNIKITEFGDVFLKYAKGALSEVEKGKLKLKEMKNNSDMIISISSTACIGATFIPFLISSFFNDNSKVKFNIDNQSTDEILKGIKNNHVDFGFISDIKALGCHYGINQVDKNGEFDEKKNVTFLTGCLQLIRREVFENIGIYDHEYFLYMEDVDFCKRAIKAGYKLMYIPKSKIYHKVSASTGGDESPLQLYYMTRNRILFNKKNEKNIIKSILFYIFIIIKMGIEPFRKKQKYKYMLEGIKDGLKGKYGSKDIKSI